MTVSEIVYPEPTDFAQAGQKEPLAVFEQRFVVGARLTLDATVAAGDLIVPARFRYQACDASTCFAPSREETRWTLKVVSGATPVVAAPSRGLRPPEISPVKSSFVDDAPSQLLQVS